MQKFNFSITAITLSLFMACNAAAASLPTNETVTMPEQMSPLTLIAYDENCNMEIIRDGTRHYSVSDVPSNTLEDTSGLEEENALIDQIRKEAANYPHIEVAVDYTAHPNTYVLYGSDGKIHRVYKSNPDISTFTYEDALDNDPKSYHPYAIGKREAPGVYDLREGNKITITSKHVLGEGRLSTFGELASGEIGENGKNDKNKTGDCATRGEMDNPPYHQQIQVRNLDKDIVKTLRKNDNGKLPHAVLDIYKWDGVYFGETWFDGFTFENGRYYYEF